MTTTITINAPESIVIVQNKESSISYCRFCKQTLLQCRYADQCGRCRLCGNIGYTICFTCTLPICETCTCVYHRSRMCKCHSNCGMTLQRSYAIGNLSNSITDNNLAQSLSKMEIENSDQNEDDILHDTYYDYHGSVGTNDF